MAAVAAMPHAPQFRAALIAGDTAKATELARGWESAGYKMTVFSASEEKVIEDNILHAKLYFNMPDALRIAGADVSVTPIDFDPSVVEDRELITGQNPLGQADRRAAHSDPRTRDRARVRGAHSWHRV
jgi:putative intracellular protease/amidase